MKERRQHGRTLGAGKVRLNWRTESGATFSAMARCLDLSKRGARLEVDRSIPPSTLVQIESPQLKLAGVAVVRDCRKKESRQGWWEVGVQFGGGLEWRGEKPAG